MNTMFTSKKNMTATLNAWNDKTFDQALSEMAMKGKNEKAIELLKTVIRKQRIGEKQMNGDATEGMKLKEVENLGIAYVTVFNRTCEKYTWWTPVEYLYELCLNNTKRKEFYDKKAAELGITYEHLAVVMCGRALRALPSFIREYQLANALHRKFPSATFCQDEYTDKYFHCDVKMEMNEQTYFFWSFIASEKSVRNFVQKFSDSRFGHVNDGIHVLCPFDRRDNVKSGELKVKANYLGWHLYSREYLDVIENMVNSGEHKEYSELFANGSVCRLEMYHEPMVVYKNAA